MKTFYIETFGCQMNAHDSEKVVGTLQHEGYVQVTFERRLPARPAGWMCFGTAKVSVGERQPDLRNDRLAHPAQRSRLRRARTGLHRR